MGRRATGWKLRQKHGPGTTYTVRFWRNGQSHERSTGSSDPQEAGTEAAKIYALEVGRVEQRPRRRTVGAFSFRELLALWLVALESTHAPTTVATWTVHGRRWVNYFGELHNLTPARCADFMRDRLKQVQRQTIMFELTALRIFIAWLVEQKHLGSVIELPTVPAKSTGTKCKERKRVAAIPISPDEVQQIIALLPEWSKKRPKFAVRARFLVAYHTSLRPSTLDRLVSGLHYSPGDAMIVLTPDIDKNRFAREVPLDAVARETLEALEQEPGKPLFGSHDYRPHLFKAAKVVLGLKRAESWCGAHFRSARITHLLEQTGNLPGVQFLSGHRLATTTALYAKASLRAAQDVLEASGG